MQVSLYKDIIVQNGRYILTSNIWRTKLNKLKYVSPHRAVVFVQSTEAKRLVQKEICRWSSAGGRYYNYIWVINKFITYWGATYVREMKVCKI